MTFSIGYTHSTLEAMATNSQEYSGPLGRADDGGADGGWGNPADQFRADWVALKPNRSNYFLVVQELNGSKLMGECNVFERGSFVSLTHMGYFRPQTDAFIADLKSKDRKSAKECEHINPVGVWLDLGLVSLEVAGTGS